jgi:hypothetical protein
MGGNGLFSGIVGGIIAAILIPYVARRVGTAKVPGQLSYGLAAWIVATSALLMAIFPIAITLFANHHTQFWAKAGLSMGCGIAAIYCFAEAACVRGTYDDEGLTLYTPWTGLKQANWKDLDSVQRNDWGGWYSLKFRDGTTIRLSRLLGGHLSALKKANVREF